MAATFELVSKFQPAGDQPQAIEKLVAGFREGKTSQVLLGATGTGKTFTASNVIAQLNKPTLVLSHNKTLAAQLYKEFKAFFPRNAVHFFISYYDYYQPEAYIPQKAAISTSKMTRSSTKISTACAWRPPAPSSAGRTCSSSPACRCIYGLGSPSDYKAARDDGPRRQGRGGRSR